MSVQKKTDIAGLKLDRVSFKDLLAYNNSKIPGSGKTIITYANANTINLLYKDNRLSSLLNSFDMIHPDGVGIYLASRLLYGANGLPERVTGSDFYPMLIEQAIKNNLKIFFFGHDKVTLNRIKEVNPSLNICGTGEGYNYNSDTVILQIAESLPDILVIGLGQPLQEKWIKENIDKLNFRVCYCVGDGIKVFAGIKKRGPKFFRAMGLEWMVRLLTNPFRYFKRYVIGNPLFLYRIIILKMRKFTQ